MNNVFSIDLSPEVSAVFAEGGSFEIFEAGDSDPVPVTGSPAGYVPWGVDNKQPEQIRQKVYDSDILSPNSLFNILTCYGRGLEYKENNTLYKDEIKTFFKRNRPVMMLWEAVTDIKFWSWAVVTIIVDAKGEKIVQLIHKEAMYCRFETCDKATGQIKNVLFANWEDNESAENPEIIPLLNTRDPWGDLMTRLGRLPNNEGITEKGSERKFAYVIKIPSPGQKYYPFPYWQSTFRSGWYDLHAKIPKIKAALMKNGMKIRYHVEIHRNYFKELFSLEGVTDPEKQQSRRELEIKSIKEFLSGLENGDKVWFSGYYIDPNKVEQRMVRINVIDTSKQGGEWIEDAEEAANFLCYAQGVHPSMNGATPGKSKGSMGGSDKRELFTMKQALEKPIRDLFLDVYNLVADVNEWDVSFSIPDIMLTTLDKGGDAKKVSQFNKSDDDSK